MLWPNQKNAYLICDQTNIAYLTGFVGADPSIHEAYLLMSEKKWYLMTNSLYIERAGDLAKEFPKKENIPNDIQLTVINISRDQPVWIKIKDIVIKHEIQTIAIEETKTTVEEYLQLEKILPDITLSPMTEGVESLRERKDKTEIRVIRLASSITDDCYASLLPLIKPGLSETHLAARITAYFLYHGAQSAFEPIVAFGSHASQPHYIPTEASILKSHSFLLIDFGARVHRYASDMTRMVFLGTPDKHIQNAYKAVLAAQESVILSMRNKSPNVYDKKTNSFSGAKLDTLAKSMIRTSGYEPYSHGLGHGLGLEIHENPRLTMKKDMKVHTGMAFTVEPGTYEPGKFGIRIEDTVLLSQSGLEILTKTTKEMVII